MRTRHRRSFMTMDKGCLIKDIADGRNVEGVFLVKEMKRAETRTGSPYLMLTIMDRSGEMEARVWDNADELQPQCPAGAFVRLSGQAQAYKGVVQLKINTLTAVDAAGLDMAQFVPTAAGDPETMAADLVKIAGSVRDPHLNRLLAAFFKDKQFMAGFMKAPAAKNMHHAYIGGLLEHTLAVARLAEQVCALYPALDRSLLLAGALLHDIGKVREFSFDVYPFNYSDDGRLVGHMVLAIEMIAAKTGRLKGFPPELATRVKHLILSHHGRHEFGTPTLPMMLEAFVLNFLDDLDAKINYFDRLRGTVEEPGYQWTDYQRTLERFLYVSARQEGEQDAGPGPAEGAVDEFDPRQRNLWN